MASWGGFQFIALESIVCVNGQEGRRMDKQLQIIFLLADNSTRDNFLPLTSTPTPRGWTVNMAMGEEGTEGSREPPRVCGW